MLAFRIFVLATIAVAVNGCRNYNTCTECVNNACAFIQTVDKHFRCLSWNEYSSIPSLRTFRTTKRCKLLPEEIISTTMNAFVDDFTTVPSSNEQQQIPRNTDGIQLHFTTVSLVPFDVGGNVSRDVLFANTNHTAQADAPNETDDFNDVYPHQKQNDDVVMITSKENSSSTLITHSTSLQNNSVPTKTGDNHYAVLVAPTKTEAGANQTDPKPVLLPAEFSGDESVTAINSDNIQVSEQKQKHKTLDSTSFVVVSKKPNSSHRGAKKLDKQLEKMLKRAVRRFRLRKMPLTEKALKKEIDRVLCRVAYMLSVYHQTWNLGPQYVKVQISNPMMTVNGLAPACSKYRNIRL